jgi:hypothetical protein
MRSFTSGYLLWGAAPASFVVQNAVVGVVKEHTQPATAQGWVALHVPPQVNPLAWLRNCRAETVPALRTAMTMIQNRRGWMVFFMMFPFLAQFHLFGLRLDSRRMRRAKARGGLQREGAHAAGTARMGRAAAPAAGKTSGRASQLAG